MGLDCEAAVEPLLWNFTCLTKWLCSFPRLIRRIAQRSLSIWRGQVVHSLLDELATILLLLQWFHGQLLELVKECYRALASMPPAGRRGRAAKHGRA